MRGSTEIVVRESSEVTLKLRPKWPKSHENGSRTNAHALWLGVYVIGNGLNALVTVS